MPEVTIFSPIEINKVLKLIEEEYSVAYSGIDEKSTELMQLYSTMAVLTLSGWLEDGMKELVNLSMPGLSVIGQKRLVDRTRVNGSSYEHLTKRLGAAFGSHGLEFIESEVGASDIAILTSILATLKNLRNDASHSYAAVISKNPTAILSDANKLLPILGKIEIYAKLYRTDHF